MPTQHTINLSIDSYDNIVKVYETSLKDFFLKWITEHAFNVRHLLEFTFEASPEVLKQKMAGLGTVYDMGGLGGQIVATDKYIVKADITKEEKLLRFRVWAICKNVDVEEIRRTLLEAFSPLIYSEMSLDVTWAILSGNRVEYITMQTELSEIVLSEAYPFLGDLDSYIDGYLDHKSPVLILIGPPGTGKTRLIKKILKTIGERKSGASVRERNGRPMAFDEDNNPRNPSILYSMEDKIFKEDGFFVTFLSDTYDAMVLEDIDFNLGSRKDGNTFMYKLLGGSDGIISGVKKKIILSTNLRTVQNIDEALLRPGRCFGTIHTRALSRAEAQIVADILHKDLSKLKKKKDSTKDEITLAEIYNIPS